MKDDSYYMGLCEKLGDKAEAKGNPPVGSLIIKNNEVIAEAEEAGKSKNDITCHAEIEALRIAVKNLQTNNLSDCILYTTHEPCIMCSYVIRFYKIKKVVYQNTVDYLGGISSSMPLLLSDEIPPHWAKAPEIVHFRKEAM
ncbi:MAG: nucleoside deaminase [Ginsengibacter sp.]